MFPPKSALFPAFSDSVRILERADDHAGLGVMIMIRLRETDFMKLVRKHEYGCCESVSICLYPL